MCEIYILGIILTYVLFSLALRKVKIDMDEITQCMLIIGSAIVWPVTWLAFITYAILETGKQESHDNNC